MEIYDKLEDFTDDALVDELIYAATIDDTSLGKCLNRLNDRNDNTKVRIARDWAPHSFYFVRLEGETVKGNGGIIYHKNKDSNRWQIHT